MNRTLISIVDSILCLGRQNIQTGSKMTFIFPHSCVNKNALRADWNACIQSGSLKLGNYMKMKNVSHDAQNAEREMLLHIVSFKNFF